MHGTPVGYIDPKSFHCAEEDNNKQQPYSHTYAAYIAAFGDPNMMPEYSDSYGAASNSDGAWQPRELTVEEEVRALMDELIYRVDPYVSGCLKIEY